MSGVDVKTIAIGVIIGLLVGGGIGYMVPQSKVSELQNGMLIIQNQVSDLEDDITDYLFSVNTLTDELETLSIQYDDALAENEELILDLTDLQSDYNELLNEYTLLLESTLDDSSEYTALNLNDFYERNTAGYITTTDTSASWTKMKRDTLRDIHTNIDLDGSSNFEFNFEIEISEYGDFNGIYQLHRMFRLVSTEGELVLYPESLDNENQFNLVFHQRIGSNTFTWYTLHEGTPMNNNQKYYITLTGNENKFQTIIYSDEARTTIVNDSGIKTGEHIDYNELYLLHAGGVSQALEGWSSGTMSNLQYKSQ